MELLEGFILLKLSCKKNDSLYFEILSVLFRTSIAFSSDQFCENAF